MANSPLCRLQRQPQILPDVCCNRATGSNKQLIRSNAKTEIRNFENVPIRKIQFRNCKNCFGRSTRSSDFSATKPVKSFEFCRQLVGGSRASALLSLRSSLSPVVATAYPWYTCPTPGLSRGEPQRAEGKAATRAMPTTRARRPQSARSPSVAPKRHGVGRVARRARPDIARHCKACCTPTPPYPKGGA